jgi:formate hydrogenlyase subunit 3/multisubunit Na+/H+ antiporter MnhD subunit
MFSFSWLAYLFVYRISLLVVILWIEKDQITNLSQLYSRNITIIARTVFFLGIASLGGLPPLTGFWVKLVILLGLLRANILTISAILLIGTIWILYLYIRIRFLSGGQGRTRGIWFPTMNNDSLYFGLVIITFLPILILIGLFLLGGVTHKILIFKILE